MTKKIQHQRTLKISGNLSLPLTAVTSTLVVYGMKGMGKTNFGGVLVEELHAAGQRFSVIDPMGVWWGLQHSATKDEAGGIDVLILGGIHGDLPIEPTAGAVVADLVVDESVSVVIDISRHASGKAWTSGEKIRFVTAYITRLYERQAEQRRPIMQLIDEAARFAPQAFLGKIDADVANCLGAISLICEEGRNLGIGLTLMTLRSARLNNNVAELADMLVAFRTVGPSSVDAIMHWCGAHTPKEQHKQIVEDLRKLPIGSALVISPGWLEHEGIVPIRMRHTFDSSATPTTGTSLRAPGKARKPDLAKYQVRMAETIEQAAANDPKKLRAKAAALKAEVDKLTQEVIKWKTAQEKTYTDLQTFQAENRELKKTPAKKDVPVITAEDRKVMNKLIQRSEQVLAATTAMGETSLSVAHALAGIDHRISQVSNSVAAVPAPGGIFVTETPNGLMPSGQAKPSPVPPPVKPAPAPAPDGNGAAPPLTGDGVSYRGQIKEKQAKMLDTILAFNRLGSPYVSKGIIAAFADMKQSGGSFGSYLSLLKTGAKDGSYPSLINVTPGGCSLTPAGEASAQSEVSAHTLEDLHDAWRRLVKNPKQVMMLNLIIQNYPNATLRKDLAAAVGMEMSGGSFGSYLSIMKSFGILEYTSTEDGSAVAATPLLFPAALN